MSVTFKDLLSTYQFSADNFFPLSTSNSVTEDWGTFFGSDSYQQTLRQVSMNTQMEFRFQVECLQDVAVVNCSGRMVRGSALDRFERRIELLNRVRMLVLDVSEVEQLDAGGLGALLLVRSWATRNSAKMKLVNPPLFFRRLLEATRLNSVFEISSLKEALCILRSPDCPPRFAVA